MSFAAARLLPFKFVGGTAMNKKDALSAISKAARLYETELCNKYIMILYGAPSYPEHFIINCLPTHFNHLTGVTTNGIDNYRFYQMAINNKLSERDFELKDNNTELKLQVLSQTIKLRSNAKMVGTYSNNGNHVMLQTDKLAGGIKSCMGFVLTDNGLYVPNTVLKANIINEVDKYERVLAIISKPFNCKSIGTVEYVADKIDLSRLLDKTRQVFYTSFKTDHLVRYGTLVKYFGNKEQPTIPESVKNIGDMAFMGNTSIKHAEIPDTVEHIGKQAFEDCTNLKSASIPKTCYVDITAFPRTCNVHRNNYSRLDKTLKHD